MSEYESTVGSRWALAMLSGFLGCGLCVLTKRIIPQTHNIYEGYVKTSELEIKLLDLDEDGENETTFKYKGKSYLALDQNGEMKAIKYELTPKEIISPKIIYREVRK